MAARSSTFQHRGVSIKVHPIRTFEGPQKFSASLCFPSGAKFEAPVKVGQNHDRQAVKRDAIEHVDKLIAGGIDVATFTKFDNMTHYLKILNLV